VLIARPSKWGNLFSHKASIAKHKTATKAESLYKHKEWVLSNPEFILEIKKELAGKILGCWCDNPYSCHGFILWKIANNIAEQPAEIRPDTRTLF